VVEEDGVKTRAAQYRETLPDGRTHTIIDLDPNGELDNTPLYHVPAGHVFMMGDNRDDSADSRVPEVIGFVPIENLIGRADVIFFSIGDGAAAWQFWRWPWTIRFGRLASRVQ
jgi:signal peptidase I